jgi:signal transduction histidine kinase/ActR/RegA family two-component response regulator
VSADGHSQPDPAFLARRLAREHRARLEAENLLEAKSRELHLANEDLARLNAALEARVAERTRELDAARQAAVSASAAKSEFFARMSHEIRTPLNSVIGSTVLLRDELSAPSQRALLDTISASSELLLALVNDVLDFARIEAGRLELVPAPFDLAALVHRCADLFRTTAQGKGLALLINCPLPSPTFVVGDSLRLQQVLVNLLGNALKFTQAGQVSLSVHPSPASPDTPPTYRFAVADTGPGLDQTQITRLFQPFSQAGHQAEDRAGGSGLGLVTCERIVALAGGSLHLDSTPGLGSVFSFALPLPTASATPGEAVPDALAISRDSSPLRIVLADDLKANLDILSHILRRMGHEVSSFLSGTEALAHLSAHPADLAMIDLQMPGMDGLETARRIRTLPLSGPLLRLVAFTADARVETTDACLAAGFDACLHKPVRPPALRAVLDRLHPRPSPSAPA